MKHMWKHSFAAEEDVKSLSEKCVYRVVSDGGDVNDEAI